MSKRWIAAALVLALVTFALAGESETHEPSVVGAGDFCDGWQSGVHAAQTLLHERDGPKVRVHVYAPCAKGEGGGKYWGTIRGFMSALPIPQWLGVPVELWGVTAEVQFGGLLRF